MPPPPSSRSMTYVLPKADWRRSRRSATTYDTGARRQTAISPSTRLAVGPYRTLGAFWLSCHANQRSQLHDGLIEAPGAFAVLGHEGSRQLPDFRCALHVARCTIEEHAAEHTVDVGIDSRHRLLVGERSHGARGVRPDTRKLDQLVGFVGQRAIVVPTDHARERVEIGGACVVPQPVPLLSHSPGLRVRERLEVRKPLDKPRIVCRHPPHLCLLQHELGDEDAIGIARATPRKVARGPGPPGEQLATKPRPLFRSRAPHPLSPSPQSGEGGRRTGLASPLSTTWRGGQGVRGGRTGHGSPRYCTWQTGRSSRLTRYDWSRARASARSTTWGGSASSWSTCSAGSPSGASGCRARSSRRSRWATARCSSCCSWPRSRAPSRASRPATSSPARSPSTTPAPSSPNR